MWVANKSIISECYLSSVTGFTLKVNQNAIGILVDNFVQKFDEYRQRFFIQSAFKHAFLHPYPIVLQSLRDAVPLATFDNIVADDIISLLRHEVFIQNRNHNPLNQWGVFEVMIKKLKLCYWKICRQIWRKTFLTLTESQMI